MRVNIIGGGVVGMMTAYQLLKTNTAQHITIFDQAEIGKASSHAGGGILTSLSPWHYKAEVHHLAESSLEMYTALQRDLLETTGIDIELRECGMVLLNQDIAEYERAIQWYNLRLKNQYNPTQAIDAKQLTQINPRITPKSHMLWCPQIMQVRNPCLVRALIAYLTLKGVIFQPNTMIQTCIMDQDTIHALKDHTGKLWFADQFIITAGAWSGLITEQLGLTLPIKPIRGQMLLFKAEPNWLTTMVMQRGIYLIPRKDGHILCGSTLEDVGFDTTTTADAISHLQDNAFDMVPELANIPQIKAWAGLRPASPDNIPFIGQIPHLQNAWLNAGQFRYGILLAPASAQLLVALMRHESSTLNASDYAIR